MRTLYETTRRLSGRFKSTSKPATNEVGALIRTVEE